MAKIKLEDMPTTIIQVKDQPSQPTCPYHKNAILFQVAAGSPQAGMRGCTICLGQLLGPLHWDKSRTADYNTGHISARQAQPPATGRVLSPPWGNRS